MCYFDERIPDRTHSERIQLTPTITIRNSIKNCTSDHILCLYCRLGTTKDEHM